MNAIKAISSDQAEKYNVYHGDCRDVMMNRMEPESVHCVVTSPPYWGLRDYGVEGQLGLEPVPDCLGWATGTRCGECFICRMVDVFRGVWRVLREDGTCWVNMGDRYAANRTYQVHNTKAAKEHTYSKGATIPDGLKPKDLVGIPWRLALALQADGWYLRSDIIWAKKNCMPESVTDRPTKSHEYLFLLSKSARYYYDSDAVREDGPTYHRKAGGYQSQELQGCYDGRRGLGFATKDITTTGRNRRSVWSIATQPYSGAHFATFPPKLVEPCIKAGTSEKGCCPECGAGWVRVVEKTQYEPRIVPNGTRNVDESRGDKTRKLSGKEYNEQAKSTTTGWTPQCTCAATDPIPCTVMDPFAGSGTTGVVAMNLFRRFEGIELSEKYLNDILIPRLDAEANRFKQTSLFDM